jgi:hypothetical protein
MTDIVFLPDALMARDAFVQLPTLIADAAGVAAMAKKMAGKLCRAEIEREGRREWHALAWLYINGTERVTAARVKFGNYRAEN